MPTKLDYSKIVGQKFGYLTFVKDHHVEGRGRRYVELKCECGNTVIAMWDNVKGGKTKSCGCKRWPDTNYTKDPLYTTWHSMKDRCYCKSAGGYYNYGAKGVMVCDEWKNNFPAFRDWALANGWRKGLQIDKDIKGTGKLYSPDNCMFVSKSVNMKNTQKILRIRSLIPYIKESELSSYKLAKEINVSCRIIQEIRNGKYRYQ